MNVRYVLAGTALAAISLLLVATPSGAFPRQKPPTAVAPKFVVYAGYADCPNPTSCDASTITNPRFPYPWLGATNVTYIGDKTVGNPKKDSDPDTSALRIDNTGKTAITIGEISFKTCDGGALDLWGTKPFKYPYTIAPGKIDIFSSTSGDNFDGSDQCDPKVKVTVEVDGTKHTYDDDIANGGKGAIFGGKYSPDSGDESTPWTKIAGGKVTIVMVPLKLPSAKVGKGYSVPMAVQDSNGAPVLTPVSLPPGLKLVTKGQNAFLAGKPTKSGTFKFHVTLSDSASPKDVGTASYTLVVT